MKKLLYLFMLVTGLFFASCEDTAEEIEVIDTEVATDGSEDEETPAGSGGG